LFQNDVLWILYYKRVWEILFGIFAWSWDNIKYILKKLWIQSENMLLNFEKLYMKIMLSKRCRIRASQKPCSPKLQRTLTLYLAKNFIKLPMHIIVVMYNLLWQCNLSSNYTNVIWRKEIHIIVQQSSVLC